MVMMLFVASVASQFQRFLFNKKSLDHPKDFPSLAQLVPG